MLIELSTEYSEDESAFLTDHSCKILSEITLPNFFNCEIPNRMFVYGGSYIGEIYDDGELVWAILSKFKGKFRWGECYEDFKALEDGL